MKALVPQLCLILWDPMDCSPQGSSVHGTLQERILAWVAIPFSRGSSRPKDQTGSPVLQAFLYHLSHQGFHSYLLQIPQNTAAVKQSRKKNDIRGENIYNLETHITLVIRSERTVELVCTSLVDCCVILGISHNFSVAVIS